MATPGVQAGPAPDWSQPETLDYQQLARDPNARKALATELRRLAEDKSGTNRRGEAIAAVTGHGDREQNGLVQIGLNVLNGQRVLNEDRRAGRYVRAAVRDFQRAAQVPGKADGVAGQDTYRALADRLEGSTAAEPKLVKKTEPDRPKARIGVSLANPARVDTNARPPVEQATRPQVDAADRARTTIAATDQAEVKAPVANRAVTSAVEQALAKADPADRRTALSAALAQARGLAAPELEATLPGIRQAILSNDGQRLDRARDVLRAGNDGNAVSDRIIRSLSTPGAAGDAAPLNAEERWNVVQGLQATERPALGSALRSFGEAPKPESIDIRAGQDQANTILTALQTAETIRSAAADKGIDAHKLIGTATADLRKDVDAIMQLQGAARDQALQHLVAGLTGAPGGAKADPGAIATLLNDGQLTAEQTNTIGGAVWSKLDDAGRTQVAHRLAEALEAEGQSPMKSHLPRLAAWMGDHSYDPVRPLQIADVMRDAVTAQRAVVKRERADALDARLGRRADDASMGMLPFVAGLPALKNAIPFAGSLFRPAASAEAQIVPELGRMVQTFKGGPAILDLNQSPSLAGVRLRYFEGLVERLRAGGLRQEADQLVAQMQHAFEGYRGL